MSSQLESGGISLFIVRYYIFPAGTLTIESVIVEIYQVPCGSALQVAGDFNEYLEVMEGDRHL